MKVNLILVVGILIILSCIMPASATLYANGKALADGDRVFTGDMITWSGGDNIANLYASAAATCGLDAYYGVPPIAFPAQSTMEPLTMTLYYSGAVQECVEVNYNPLYGERPPEAPIAGFTVDPGFEGHPPFYVQFFDNSQKVTAGTEFSFDFGDGQSTSGPDWIAALEANQHGSQQYLDNTYTELGNYTVSLTLTNVNGTHTFSEVIAVFNSSVILPGDIPGNSTSTVNPGLTVNLDIKDAITGALIQNAGCGILNVSSGVWRNSTAPTGLVFYDSTDSNPEFNLSKGQQITLAAWDSNHKPDSVSFQIPYDNYRAYLNLVPNTVVTAEGTGTVVATVVRNKDGLPISGASVSIENGAMGSTNTAGAFTFTNVTAGSHTITVSTPYYSYSSASQSFNVSAGETKMVMVQLVEVGSTPVPTYVKPTTTAGTGTGTGTGYGSGNISPGALNAKGSQGLTEMMDFVIGLWPLALLMLFLLFMKKV